MAQSCWTESTFMTQSINRLQPSKSFNDAGGGSRQRDRGWGKGTRIGNMDMEGKKYKIVHISFL